MGLNTGGADAPGLGDVGRQCCRSFERRLQPQPLSRFQACRLMDTPLQLQQLGIALDLPEAIALQHMDVKGLGTLFLVSADCGLVLACQSSNRVTRLKPDQPVETAELVDRNHALAQGSLILGRSKRCCNPQFWGVSGLSGQEQHSAGATTGADAQQQVAVMAFHR